MITINEAKRMIKRVLLANILTDKKNLALTPLVSGKHGIGKSAMIKSIADDLGGVCITVEGGTLKEGEITGLPYQYKDDNGKIRFRFLPYYAIDRIQSEEKRLFEAAGKTVAEDAALSGDENLYAMNDLTAAEKIEALKSGRVKIVIIFIDEINRTENTVYKELMNILLTRSVNGYEFPWWVLFVGAMNPSTQNSVYATNEMDPAQLDRFIKIKVGESSKEWLKYGEKSGMSEDILRFIKDNPKMLSEQSKELEDEEKPTPSPRGWDMVDTLLKSADVASDFFTAEENDPKIVEKDLKELVSAKLGSTVATMFFTSMVKKQKALNAEDIFADDATLSKMGSQYDSLPAAKKVQTNEKVLNFLKENLEFMMLSKSQFEINKAQIALLVSKMDSSTRLLFAQNLANMNTNEGNSMMELLFDVFEEELIEMLDLSDATREKIAKSDK